MDKKHFLEHIPFLLKSFSSHPSYDVIFFYEKLFLLQDSHNAQNDRVYLANMADIPIYKKKLNGSKP